MSYLIYIFESVLCCGLFYALYRLLLEGRIPHRYSAIYLVVSTLFGHAIPLLELPLYPAKAETVILPAEPIEFLPIEIPAELQPRPTPIDWMAHLAVAGVVIYVLVVLFNLTRLFYNWLQVRKIYRSATLSHRDGYTLALSSAIREPFSFWCTIYLSPELSGVERDQILAHELSHVKHRHTLERIVMELLRSLFWVNPFIWLCCMSLCEVHEWEADEDVLSQGYKLNEYRKIIFRQLFGYNPDIANGLHNQKTKKRFIMMTSFRKDKLSFVRFSTVIPLAVAMVLAFGAVRAEADDAVLVIESQPSEKVGPVTDESTVYISADRKITFNGKETTIEELKSALEKMREEAGVSAVLTIKADGNARVGQIDDVKAVARETKILRIIYDVPLGGEMTIDRVLPPKTTTDPKAMIPVVEHMADRNLLTLYINALGKVLTTRPDGSQAVVDMAELKSIIKAFVDNSESIDGKRQVKNPNYADFTWQTIPRGEGEVHYPVSNGIVSLVTVRDTQVDKFMKIQETIIAAYTELREELSERSFSKSFEELSLDERRFIMRAIPIKVREQDTANPK
ncbi:MAG: biopolymer transporter ExbD [Alistipes sp.]|nr:biopolymer transporter ExbD [Alistipes sp.]